MNKDSFQSILGKARKKIAPTQEKEAIPIQRTPASRGRGRERFKSTLINPRNQGIYRGLITPEKQYTMRMLRRISERAWLINAVIGHLIDKTAAYLRPESAQGPRHFAIELKDRERKMTKVEKAEAKRIQEFFLQTGWDRKLYHEDDLLHYTKKILRDILTLDQATTEKLWSRGGDLLSFEAVDAATILRCNEEGFDGENQIRYVQMIDSQVQAKFEARDLIFQIQNPRTDIDHFGYGYSKIEQCLSLVTSLINSFDYNAAAFTKDFLPRGMLLLDGDLGFDEMEQMEDYLVDVMGGGVGGPSGKWGIPIIPSGGGADKSSIKWQALGNSNQDMQYSRWQDTLYMAVGSVYGVDTESMGIKTEKGAKLIESGSAEGRKYSDDKGVGNALIFLERHFQGLLDSINPRFAFVFHGFEQDDAKETREAVEHELATYKSLNDIRKERDLPPSKLEFADIPGLQNPQYHQAYQAEKGAEAEAAAAEAGGGMGMGPGQEGEPGGEEQEEPAERSSEWDEFGKSLKIVV